MSARAPLGITLGDAAGIGPEIIAKAYRQEPALLHACVVVGDVDAMRRAAALVCPPGQLPLPVAALHAPEDWERVPPACIPVWQQGEALAPQTPGRISAQAGAYAGYCVLQAARAALRGDLAALVTAPLHKEALAAAGAPYAQYPGHTEMLQAAAAEHLGCSTADLPVRMMLASDSLRTVLVSIHVSLREAIDAVCFDSVFETVRITHFALQRLLGRAPRIAVAGLNPHAGEGGRFGSEEARIITPAVAAAQAQGWQVSGPWPPDTVFMRARRTPQDDGAFDVVVAMYHDQGLIPVKFMGLEQGVNVTLGLPLVRTSPDHGTAFDIAGTGRADAASLLAALRMARALLTS